ncbi:MAG: nickel transporter permease [Eubacteriales bacterium]
MNRPVTIRVQKVKKNRIRTRLFIFLFLAAVLVLVSFFADQIVPYDPYAQNLSLSRQPPSAAHFMGTDQYGRDVFSRVVVGAKASVFSTLILVCVTSVFGTLVGTLCGYFGRGIDSVVMRISDVCLAFPGLVFALAIAALLGGGMSNAVIALAVISWPKYARVARGQTLALKDSDFVAAARLAGDNSVQMIRRHILPNILGPILVTAMLDIGTMMMELAGLSFLGLGAQPPVAEWGNMMSGGRSMLQTYPWLVLSPGVAIFLTVVTFNLLGDTVRDYMDPKNSESQ